MKKTKLQTKLLILLALPMVGVLFFGGQGAWEKWRVARECAALENSSTVLSQFGGTVHELQKERGRSAVFLGSKGAKFAAELPAQQQATDGQIAKLTEALKKFDPAGYGSDFEHDYKVAIESLGQLPAKRSAINSLTLPVPESAAYYTHTITLLLDLSVAQSHFVKDHDVAAGMAAYVNYLQAKEQTGIERAILAGVFTADKFTGDTFARFNKAVASQDTFLNVFTSFASADQKKFVSEKIRGDAVESVAKMRQTAADKAGQGGFGVSSGTWFDTITAKIDLMKEVEDRLSADYVTVTQHVKTSAQRVFAIFAGLTAAVLLVTIVVSIWTIRSITGPLRQVINELNSGSDSVGSAASQVASASQTLAEGASEQAASLEETSASLEEMTSMVKRNADSAQQAKEISSQTRVAADTGARDMDQMQSSMAAIKTSSDEIAKIVKNIDEIAFQTNILALNAAVEAARAGEAGAGFAVVADEVRNLAQRSANAAKETANKIEDAIAKTTQGVQVSGKVAESLKQIIEKARTVDDLVGEIASASKEQSQGISQVNTAVTQMDKVTQSNAASAEESASASEELSSQAQAVKDSVEMLQALVDGSGRGRQGSTRHDEEVSHQPAPVKKRMASRPAARTSAHTPDNGSSHNNGRQEVAAVVTNGRNSADFPMPQESEFKDF